jgi:hypothetical protein
MTIRRRNFLSMMAAAPFAASIAGLLDGCSSETPSQSSRYYVWAHGIVGISWTKPTDGTKPPGIRLVCPNLTAQSGGAHSYSVGRITGNGEDLYLLKKSGTSKSEYSFDGLTSSCNASATKLEVGSPSLHGALKNDFDGYVYYLPCPSKIIPLRSFFANFKCSGTCSDFPQGDMWLPMVHVFVYENVAPENVKLISNATKQAVWGGKKSNHCHLFVEPDDIHMEDEKYGAALKGLRECFEKTEDISIEDREPCLRLDDVSGFCNDLREQFYIYEWRNQSPCSIGKPKTDKNHKTGDKTYKPQGCPQFWVIEV